MKIKQIWLVIMSVFLAGFDPFLPWGSVILAWAGVLGVKKRSWWAIIGLILGGLVCDVLSVGRAGITSAMAIFTWFISAFIMEKLEQPLIAVFISSGLGAIFLFSGENRLWAVNILATAFYGLIIILVWRWAKGEEKTIRLRQ